MPEIARFYGIIIRMYFLPGEHNQPHIHAIYHKSMVIEWVKIHQSELLEMWNTQTIKHLQPLE